MSFCGMDNVAVRDDSGQVLSGSILIVGYAEAGLVVFDLLIVVR